MPLINGKFEELVIPRKHAKVLFDKSKKWRIRCLYGSRNGAKDWSVTAAIIETCVRVPKRILFTREVQKSLRASWHQLLTDQIKRLGYSQYFEVQRDLIIGHNGSMFIFNGLNDIVSKDIKSSEGIDIAVIGEAEDLTSKSYNDLNFTVRKENSEIWIIYNTKFDDDFVYDLTVLNPADNVICEKVNGFALDVDGKTVVKADNPFVSEEQLTEAQRLHDTDKDAFDNQCLGMPIGQGGRVYAIYNPEIHLIDFDKSYLPQCDLYMSIDPARKYYPAIGWHAVTPSGVAITYNEWPKYEDIDMWFDEARTTKYFDMALKDLANIIISQDLTIQYGGKIVCRTIDPRFLAENPDYTTELVRFGVHSWREAPFELIETQRENIKGMMHYFPNLPIVGSNQPDYYIDKRCRNHDRAFRHHMWDAKKDKEDETHKDFIDQVRYWRSLFGKKVTYIDRTSKDKDYADRKGSAFDYSLSTIPASAYRGVA